MRKIALLLIALNFFITPMASSLAMAMGFSGVHAHFDKQQHPSDRVVDVTDAHKHDHQATGEHDPQTGSKLDDHDDSAPYKHSHGEPHGIVFIVTTLQQLVLLKPSSSAASHLPQVPPQKHLYPPFRPPQAV